jgi:glycine dehydrogenase subunit 1
MDGATMDYVQITENQRREMLQSLGVSSVEELYRSLPQAHRLDRPLNLPAALSEMELKQRLNDIAAMNRPAADLPCFLGGGAYDHFIPTLVDHLAHQSEFVTAYTPYQAEASQGSLQAFYEFQSQVCRITGLEAANASLYEGATAVAEGVLMALNVTGKRRVLVASTVHPHTMAVLRTYTSDLPVELVVLQATTKTGTLHPDTVKAAMDNDTAALVVQSPNTIGLIEDWKGLFAATKEHEAPGKPTMNVAVFNPIACGLLERPGTCGADVAAGEGQPLGIPLQYGGPYLGLFAARKPLIRKMPGRLVGQTTDKEGQRSFCLTLQTREQHIRGAKATSNVCTNQGLLALRATVYMSAMGPQGLKEVASQCWHKAHYAADQIAGLEGYSLSYPDSPFFNEFLVDCPKPASELIQAGLDRGVMIGLDASHFGIGQANQLLIAVTEKRSREQIDALVRLLDESR